ncbi:MAG: reverse transcriptase-like protein [Candidatus Nanopelagicales bacterium]
MSPRYLIVEADGGARGNPGPAAYGCVVREAATGQLLAERADYLGLTTNNVAEYTGLLTGLLLCASLGDVRVDVRMDSKLVVEQMTGGWKIKHENMRALAAKARAAIDPARVRYQWIPRAQNKDADRLVNESLDAVEAGGSGLIVRDF